MRLILTLLASLIAAPAYAGDPCPIDFTFYDLGAPAWLDRDALLDGLISKDSWVGISFRDAEGGVTITNVSDASPAAKAGLKVGDVIAEAGGAAVQDHKAFAERLRAIPPGGSSPLKIRRGEATVEISLVLGRQDPFIGALIDYASSQECAAVTRGDLSEAGRQAAMQQMFNGKRFRCEDAHKALAGADIAGTEYGPGDIFIVRGSKRVILANTGWASACVRAKQVDGPKLNSKKMKQVFDSLTKAYIEDRYINP